MLLQNSLGTDSRVIALDLPGNGREWSQRSPSSVSEMVDAYRRELQTLNASGPVHLLGLSLGAMAAIDWAARYPQDLASAVIVNGSAGGLSRMTQRLRPAAALQLLMGVFDTRLIAREQRILSVCTNVADIGIAAQRWARHSTSARTSAANVARQLVAAMKFNLPAEQPRVPMFVIASAGDRLVSVECSIAIARRWSLPLAMHPSAGHEIALDDPAWLVRQCVRWDGGARDLE